jgi:hypothetical protein
MCLPLDFRVQFIRHGAYTVFAVTDHEPPLPAPVRRYDVHSLDRKPGRSSHESVGIIGSGIAGLITAHILLQDGFKSAEVITCDKSVGGV